MTLVISGAARIKRSISVWMNLDDCLQFQARAPQDLSGRNHRMGALVCRSTIRHRANFVDNFYMILVDEEHDCQTDTCKKEAQAQD